MNFSNPYFALLIITFVVVHVIEMISTFLNVRALRPELPEAFEGVYDRESYRKSQDYTRESSRFDMISSTLKLIIFLAFWLGGGFGWFDSLLRSWHLPVLVQGLVGISLLYLGNTLINLPFDLIDTFVIEQKHGFNKTTPKTFVGDQIKGLVIGAVLGLPLIALLLWVFESHPNAWIYA